MDTSQVPKGASILDLVCPWRRKLKGLYKAHWWHTDAVRKIENTMKVFASCYHNKWCDSLHNDDVDVNGWLETWLVDVKGAFLLGNLQNNKKINMKVPKVF